MHSAKPDGPKYPHVKVQLSEREGNAFAILGRVQTAMRRAGIDSAERQAFYNEATSGDYDHLIQTCMRWVNVN
jgi:hypothetical protein